MITAQSHFNRRRAQQHAHCHGPPHCTRQGGAIWIQPPPGICIQRFTLLCNPAAQTRFGGHVSHGVRCMRKQQTDSHRELECQHSYNDEGTCRAKSAGDLPSAAAFMYVASCACEHQMHRYMTGNQSYE
jgi:hypothetical protein